MIPKEKQKEYNRRYYLENRDRLRQKNLEYRRVHKEYFNEYYKKYNKKYRLKKKEEILKEEKRKLIISMISLFNSILAIIISLVIIFTK